MHRVSAARRFVKLATVSGTTFSATGLTPNTTYGYVVRATDAAALLGPYSNAASVTTLSTIPDLVAAYSFDEGSGTQAADSSGTGNTGAIQNATWTTAGKYANALSFNGTNAHRQYCRCCVTRSDDRHDARSLGLSDRRGQRMARCDLQGQRQLLPRSHDQQRLGSRRWRDPRDDQLGGVRHGARFRRTPGRTSPKPTTARR